MSKYKELLLSTQGNTPNSKIQTILVELLSSKNIHNAKHLLYEFISFSIQLQIPYDSFTSTCDILTSNQLISSFLVNYCTEILWLCGMSLATESKDKEIKTFASIVNYFINKKITNKNLLLEKFEENTLSQCGIVPNQTTFKNHIIRINTKLNYEQQKYNLLREESEGFSKLIFLLYEFCDMKLKDEKDIKVILDKIV